MFHGFAPGEAVIINEPQSGDSYAPYTLGVVGEHTTTVGRVPVLTIASIASLKLGYPVFVMGSAMPEHLQRATEAGAFAPEAV